MSKQGGGRTSKTEQVAKLEEKLVRNHAVVLFFAASGIAMMVAEVRANCRQHGCVLCAGWVRVLVLGGAERAGLCALCCVVAGAGAGAMWGGERARPQLPVHHLRVPVAELHIVVARRRARRRV